VTRRAQLDRVDQALTRIIRIVGSRASDRLRAERSGVDLPRPALSVLAALYRSGPARLSDLGAATHLEPALVGRSTRALAGDGLLTLERDPGDRRSTIATLTAAGREAFERHRRAADDVLDDTLRGWTPDDLALLADVLDRLASDFARRSRALDQTA
jgi:DNA-binding MarR family transcriptional regulator